jgi:uncharacterized protein YeaO (DUF488 family)
MPPPEVFLARVYDADDRGDSGYRVLVDRLWPRGVTRADAALDEWLKDAAPTSELRRWYGHDVRRFEEFARRYRADLGRPPASVAVERLIALARADTITLLTATRDVEHSGARVLRDHLLGRAVRSRRRTSTSNRGTDDAVSRSNCMGDREEGPP